MSDTIVRTEAEISRMRDRMARGIKDLGLAKKGEVVTDVMTCEKCTAKYTCRSAYDLYNTDGDCLEDK